VVICIWCAPLQSEHRLPALQNRVPVAATRPLLRTEPHSTLSVSSITLGLNLGKGMGRAQDRYVIFWYARPCIRSDQTGRSVEASDTLFRHAGHARETRGLAVFRSNTPQACKHTRKPVGGTPYSWHRVERADHTNARQARR